jgi:Kef-type K+ transport system membrane component KefB
LYSTLILLVLAGLAGPLLSNWRRPLVPVVVGELLGGIVLGRTGIGLIDPSAGAMPAFYGLGFGLLMVTAGEHVDVASPSFRASLSTTTRLLFVVAVAALPIGVGIAAIVGSVPVTLVVILLVGSSAAVVMPILDEHGLSGPAITTLTGWTGIADGATVIAMPLALTGAGRLAQALGGDLAIIALAAALLWVTIRLERRLTAQELVDRSRKRGWALQLRMSLLALIALAAIAEATGASLLVAGFATGIILARVAHSDRLALQLTGVANGLFVPAFFVLLGATLDMRALAGSPSALALALLMGLGSVAVHLIAALVAAPGERVALGLAASAQLGLPAAAAVLGLQTGALSPAFAAAFVAGGCLTILPATIGGDLLARRLGGSTVQAQEPTQPTEASR